jgi:hypothetical protein
MQNNANALFCIGVKAILVAETLDFASLTCTGLDLIWQPPLQESCFFKQPTELSADSNLFQSPDNGLQEMSA